MIFVLARINLSRQGHTVLVTNNHRAQSFHQIFNHPSTLSRKINTINLPPAGHRQHVTIIAAHSPLMQLNKYHMQLISFYLIFQSACQNNLISSQSNQNEQQPIKDNMRCILPRSPQILSKLNL